MKTSRTSEFNPHEGLITFYSDKVDEFGNPVKKTQMDYPYSYDGFVTHRFGKNEEANHTIYSDRLLQQDYAKTRTLMQKHFGNDGDYYSSREPKKIESFLKEWLGDKNLKLIFIMEYCDVSNGYPLWRFEVKTSKTK